jgi:nucleoside-diphosphate-sugar epimerase
MRIFLAGATGVIGSRVVPLLVGAGHAVAGMTRTAAKADLIRSAGAEPVVGDVYDADALTSAVRMFRPELILHELTALPDRVEDIPAHSAANARIRVEGTRNLLAAASAAECAGFLAESIAWALPPGEGADAVAELERNVLEFEGVVLRYGQLYGPGTYYPGALPAEPRVHVDAAARATVAAIGHATGVLTITDAGVQAEPA